MQLKQLLSFRSLASSLMGFRHRLDLPTLVPAEQVPTSFVPRPNCNYFATFMVEQLRLIGLSPIRQAAIRAKTRVNDPSSPNYLMEVQDFKAITELLMEPITLRIYRINIQR